ncbi:hypothetical protein JHK82_049614 [Glycine max]|uniref:Uncharacterized protein n=2 Tax=Glycine subgen. Soja TaxID=1462606 RepID=K7MQF4_SOYBN|nr:hypothetical protein JHK86_049479 [Glycine max]KAG4923740.1 hypothetical protein JHK87_049280 [Glycine soja]KAG4935323.1 hypothetical protein JHK85_050242 [Glycine max]KAG5090836.1 hypothetical protein JHK82_049614 [Glycine max]KAG5093926.1 hypothetical protein JHK84_049514 [Glycine max]
MLELKFCGTQRNLCFLCCMLCEQNLVVHICSFPCPFKGRTKYPFKWKWVSFFLAIIGVLLLGDNGMVFLTLDTK